MRFSCGFTITVSKGIRNRCVPRQTKFLILGETTWIKNEPEAESLGNGGKIPFKHSHAPYRLGDKARNPIARFVPKRQAIDLVGELLSAANIANTFPSPCGDIAASGGIERGNGTAVA
jgi:hypothetical protein